MPKAIRMTFSTAAVMQAIAAGKQYGFDIMDVSGLSEGTVYPALRRLEAVGYLSGKWESRRQAHQEGRPARRCYKLTTDGWRALRSARERYPGLVAAFPAPR